MKISVLDKHGTKRGGAMDVPLNLKSAVMLEPLTDYVCCEISCLGDRLRMAVRCRGFRKGVGKLLSRGDHIHISFSADEAQNLRRFFEKKCVDKNLNE